MTIKHGARSKATFPDPESKAILLEHGAKSKARQTDNAGMAKVCILIVIRVAESTKVLKAGG